MDDDSLVRCPACNGRGYHHCDCWPGDCICGIDDQDCDYCDGIGWIDTSYDDDADWYPGQPSDQVPEAHDA